MAAEAALLLALAARHALRPEQRASACFAALCAFADAALTPRHLVGYHPVSGLAFAAGLFVLFSACVIQNAAQADAFLPHVLRGVAHLNVLQAAVLLHVQYSGSPAMDMFVSASIALCAGIGLRYGHVEGIMKIAFVFAPSLLWLHIPRRLPLVFTAAEGAVVALALPSLFVVCLAVSVSSSVHGLLRLAACTVLGTSVALSASLILSSDPKQPTLPWIVPLCAVVFTLIAAFVTRTISSLRHACGIASALLRSRDSLSVLIAWLGLAMVTAAMTHLYCSTVLTDSPGKFAMQVVRKSYHVLVAAALIKAVHRRQFELAVLAFTAATCCFVLVEYVRTHGCLSGNAISVSLQLLRGSSTSDRGRATVSHILLLSGCILSMAATPQGKRYTSAVTLSGVFALGVMDAAAAVFGSALGGPQWRQLVGVPCGRTVSGTLAGAAALLACAAAQQWMVHAAWPTAATMVYVVECAAWEALCCHNDNIVLPLVAYIAATHAYSV